MARDRAQMNTFTTGAAEQNTPVRGERVPRVSIGLPVFNEAGLVKTALDSLLAQDFQDFELIVSDNGSTDETFRICAEYATRDARIRLYRNEHNQGALENFRVVLEHARAPYFMWAAADDRWAPEFITVLLTELEAHPEAGVIMCAIDRVLENGELLDRIRFAGEDDPNTSSYYRMLKGVTSSRKYNLFIYGLFRIELLRRAMDAFPDVLGGDRMFVCQLALATRFRYVDRVLYVRTHRSGHEEAYRREARRGSTPLRQVLTLARTLVRSSVIPRHRKLVIPVAVARYALLTLGKAYTSKETGQMINRIVNSTVRITPLRVTAVVAALAVSVLLVGVAAETAGIAAAAAVALLAGVFWTSLALFRLAWGLRKASVTLLKEARVSHLLLEESLATSRSALEKRVEEVGTVVRRELRYLTDLILGADAAPPTDKGNLLSKYARERYEKQRKTIAFARAFEESRIRELYLAEIFPGIERVALPIGAINELTGHPNKVDMLYVCAIARHLGARRIFEFGTYQGRTSYHLTFASEGAQVWTLNLPPEADPRYGPHLGWYFRGTDRERFITQLYCDSRQFDTAPHDQQFDFIFVDGDHSYDLVKNDTIKAFEMLRPGGAILWHDYAPKTEELVRFFRDFTQERPLFRIKRTCLLLHLDGVAPMTFQPHPMPPSLEGEFLESDPYWIEELYHA